MTLRLVPESERPGPCTMADALAETFERIKAMPVVACLVAVETADEGDVEVFVVPPSKALYRGLAELVWERAPASAVTE